MTHTILGFGAFRLQDLLPGEDYFASDGTACQVCEAQPHLPAHVQVWLSSGTANAVRTLRHPTALVYATSPQQARRVARRIRRRLRRTTQKGKCNR